MNPLEALFSLFADMLKFLFALEGKGTFSSQRGLSPGFVTR